MGIFYNNLGLARTGLVLHLDSANIKSYPGTGTSWYDLSGNNNTGTLVNGAVYNSSNNGNFVLDGVNDYIDTNYTMPVSNFTVSVVFKRVGGTYWAGMWGSEIWNSASGYISYFGGANSLSFGRGGGSVITTNPQNYCTITNFNFYTFTCDSSSNCQIFINSVRATTGTISLSSTIPKSILIGCRHTNDGSGTADFGGGNQTSLFQVYNKVLSATEITQNFNTIRRRYGL